MGLASTKGMLEDESGKRREDWLHRVTIAMKFTTNRPAHGRVPSPKADPKY